MKNLRESGSLEKLRDTSSFKFIERAIHDYTGMDNGTTLSSEAAVNYLDSHSSIGIFDPYFPAIMSELGREYKDGFQSLDVALPKTIMKRFEILQKVKIKRTPFTYSNASKLEIRISVHERICQAAELKFGINPSKPINRFLDLGERISSLENLLKTTYKIWLSIVCECRKSNNGKAQHYGSEYFYCANVENMPLTPCIMDGIYFFEYKEYKIPGNINEMVIYATPESIQKWLYESDLWKIFRTLLFYLDSLNYVLQKHGNTCEIFRYIPQDSTPYSWNRNSYAFLQLSQNEGVCIIPENIGKISFDDIELYTVK
ncbi:hypothetical protein [Microbulbifer rhizosphaerae]|uniref:Uncharacterized protein n=1 Tax=Microbulbifer rhizosphaerae TaxID=1562603 RepID=A0A7W4W9Q3_9GAMM|nr:hypothetical protein [Microbulbifer rhizosphaerae]MBB3060054.1 hypothetical protein [Microbulbifer rhizosphaerae]